MKPPVISNHARTVAVSPASHVVRVDIPLNDCVWLCIKFAVAALIAAVFFAIIAAVPVLIFVAINRP